MIRTTLPKKKVRELVQRLRAQQKPGAIAVEMGIAKSTAFRWRDAVARGELPAWLVKPTITTIKADLQKEKEKESMRVVAVSVDSKKLPVASMHYGDSLVVMFDPSTPLPLLFAEIADVVHHARRPKGGA